ncbi:MAG: hypothetical protein LBM17_08925 [Candidatus Accumulibacter sp.]|jgi:hypothetical protein|nr:hypothetical protein [Accumulibacter sp.]
MKKAIILAFGLMAAGQVFAGNVCTNGVPSGARINSGTVPTYSVLTGGSGFVVTSFPVKCSANVEASVDENPVAFAIGALSLRGTGWFEGSSGGGAIRLAGSCTGQCVAGQEAGGLSTLLTNATP